MPHYTRQLGWLLGLEGIALLRAQAGDALCSDEKFVGSRLAEIRGLLADPELSARPGGELGQVSTREGYATWAAYYDSGGNPLIEVEEPIVRPLLDDLARGRVLDAACGTGRHSAYLAELGHEITGLDASPEMLEHARRKVPGGDFREGMLASLPFPDASFDVVVCAMGLTYEPHLEPVLAEFARVLRPGGHAVLSDIHWLSLYLGGVSSVPGPDGQLRALPAYRHRPSDYFGAARSSGFEVLTCREPVWGDVPGGHGGSDAQRWCPDAARAAYRDTPALIIWQLRRAT